MTRDMKAQINSFLLWRATGLRSMRDKLQIGFINRVVAAETLGRKSSLFDQGLYLTNADFQSLGSLFRGQVLLAFGLGHSLRSFIARVNYFVKTLDFYSVTTLLLLVTL